MTSKRTSPPPPRHDQLPTFIPIHSVNVEHDSNNNTMKNKNEEEEDVDNASVDTTRTKKKRKSKSNREIRMANALKKAAARSPVGSSALSVKDIVHLVCISTMKSSNSSLNLDCASFMHDGAIPTPTHPTSNYARPPIVSTTTTTTTTTSILISMTSSVEITNHNAVVNQADNNVSWPMLLTGSNFGNLSSLGMELPAANASARSVRHTLANHIAECLGPRDS